jgi:hypothetical protein
MLVAMGTVFVLGILVGLYLGVHFALHRLGSAERRERYAKIWKTGKQSDKRS